MILDDFWRKNFSNLINSLPARDAETLTVLVHGRAIGVWGELGLWRKFRTVYLLRCNVNSTEYRSVETSRTRKRVFFREKWQISSSSSESESFKHSYGADVRKYSDYEREVQLSSECVYAKRSLLVSRQRKRYIW